MTSDLKGMTQVYTERLERFRLDQARDETLGLRLGWFRAALFAVGFLCYLGVDLGSGAAVELFGAGLAMAGAAFLVLVVWHRRVRARRERSRALADANQTALARMARDWNRLPQPPFLTPTRQHPYALDLDVCGDVSLFRLFTTVTLPPGAETLRHWMLEPASPEEVARRQAAVEELASSLDFRQELEVGGRMAEGPPPESLRDFLEWAEGEGWLAGRPPVLWTARILPILSAALMVSYWAGWMEGPWWLLSLGASFALGNYLRRTIHPIMNQASGGEERFGRYASILGLLLAEDFRSSALLELQESVGTSPMGAEGELRSLGRWMGWADVRYSPMAHAPLQALFVWDVHVLSALERWKERSGPYVRRWLEALGRLEALSALAALRADHPDWCFPSVGRGEREGVLAAGLGHPLLPQDRCVRNDVDIGPPGTFLFVTGSNMSGKSTLLRAVGLNAVLALAGGPVCARAMELTSVRVQTSMRTTDSLAEGVSQYMAELNRISGVVGAARREGEERVLFLLDEPLQGTNEAERRVAVQTILCHLLDAGAVGAVATHDLYLDGTRRLGSAARAVHLEGVVREDGPGPLLTFDYLLKPGRATSTNALALLRAVGLGAETAASASGGPVEDHGT